jgi:putative transposase
MRYIELNPVRAHMVEHPGEYRWSSYGANAYGRTNSLIAPHPIYTALSSDPAIRQQAYRELFSAELEPDLIHTIREALNQELVLGRDEFKIKIEQMTARQTRPGRSGRPRTQGAEEAAGDYYVL